jgi:hypothetical protein
MSTNKLVKPSFGDSHTARTTRNGSKQMFRSAASTHGGKQQFVIKGKKGANLVNGLIASKCGAGKRSMGTCIHDECKRPHCVGCFFRHLEGKQCKVCIEKVLTMSSGELVREIGMCLYAKIRLMSMLYNFYSLNTQHCGKNYGKTFCEPHCYPCGRIATFDKYCGRPHCGTCNRNGVSDTFCYTPHCQQCGNVDKFDKRCYKAHCQQCGNVDKFDKRCYKAHCRICGRNGVSDTFCYTPHCQQCGNVDKFDRRCYEPHCEQCGNADKFDERCHKPHCRRCGRNGVSDTFCCTPYCTQCSDNVL